MEPLFQEGPDPGEEGSSDAHVLEFVEQDTVVHLVKGFTKVKVEDINIVLAGHDVQEHLVLGQELGLSAPSCPGAMLGVFQESVAFQEADQGLPDHSLHCLHDMGGHGDGSVLRGFSPGPSFPDWRYPDFLEDGRNEGIIQGIIE